MMVLLHCLYDTRTCREITANNGLTGEVAEEYKSISILQGTDHLEFRCKESSLGQKTPLDNINTRGANLYHSMLLIIHIEIHKNTPVNHGNERSGMSASMMIALFSKDPVLYTVR